MDKKLYLECYSGISGDMTVAALIDLGADQKVLLDTLKSLPVDGFEVKISKIKKSGIDACDFAVILEHDNHDHDMEYLHGDAHDHGEHEHTHNEYHSHEHRGLKEIKDIINGSDMTDNAKTMALKVFGILAVAESKAHGVPVQEVHFHEVGAIDSIVDIAAAAICLDNLGISEVIVPILYEGKGFIRCQHGLIPVPVPAVSNIVQEHGIALKVTDIEGELVTPTGAAFVAAFCTSDRLPEKYIIKKTGIGAGKRVYACPGILRAMLIETSDEKQFSENDYIWKLETDIDDCSGETLGYLMNSLMKIGAREVHYTPIFTKKNRPAYTLTVICKEEDRENIENCIFVESTTIGIRRCKMERTILDRNIEKLHTSTGVVEVKICTLPNGTVRCYPENDSVAEYATSKKISFKDAYDEIRGLWRAER